MENRKIRISILTIVILLSIFACAMCLVSDHSSALAVGEGKNEAVESGKLGNATVGDILRFEITYNGYGGYNPTKTNAHTAKLVGADSSVDPDQTCTSTSTAEIMKWIDDIRLKNDGTYTDCEIGINFATATGSNNISYATMYINDAFVFAHGNYTFKNAEAASTATVSSLPKIAPFVAKSLYAYSGSVLIVQDSATLIIASPFIFEWNSDLPVVTIEQNGTFTVNCAKEGASDYRGGVLGYNELNTPLIENNGTINYDCEDANAFKFGENINGTAIQNNGTLNINGQIYYDFYTVAFVGRIQVGQNSVIYLNNLASRSAKVLLPLYFTDLPDSQIGRTVLKCDTVSAATIKSEPSVVKIYFDNNTTDYALVIDGEDGKIVLNKKYKNVFEISGKDNSYTLKRQYTKIVGGDGTTYSETALTGKSFADIIAFVKANKTDTPTIHFGSGDNNLHKFSYSVANGTITIDFDCNIYGNLFFLGTDGNSPVIKFASRYTVTSYANFYFGVGDGMTGSVTDTTRNSCGYMQNEGTFIIRQGKYQTGTINAEGVFAKYKDNNLLLIKNSGTIQINLEAGSKVLKILGFIERSTAAAIVEIGNQGNYDGSYGITKGDPIKVLVPYDTPIKDITPFVLGKDIQTFPYPTNFNTYNKIYVATSSTEKVYFSSTYEPKVTTGSDGNITVGKTIRYTTNNKIEGSIIGDSTAAKEFEVGIETTLSIEDVIFNNNIAYAYAGMEINGKEYAAGKTIYADYLTTEDFVVTFIYKKAIFDNKFEVKKATGGNIEFYAHVKCKDIYSTTRHYYFLVCSESSFANAFEVLPILEDKTMPIQLIFDKYTSDIDLDLSYSENKKVALSGSISGIVTIYEPLYDLGGLTSTVKIKLDSGFSGDTLVVNGMDKIDTTKYLFNLSGGYGTATDSDGNIVKGSWTKDYTFYKITNQSNPLDTFDYSVKETFSVDGQTRYSVVANVTNVNTALTAIKELNTLHNSGREHTIYLGEGTSGITAPDNVAVEFHNNAILQGKISASEKGFSTVALELLHGEESEVYGDSGYLGIDKKENSPTNITYNINKRLSSIRKIESEQERKLELEKHRNKCSVRARVEHPYSIIKCIFGFRKTRYKGKEKNESLLNILFACANLVRLAMQGKQLNKGAFRP